MQVGDLIKFNKTGALALILETSKEHGYTAVNLYVLGDVLANTHCSDGNTWMSEHALRTTAQVICESYWIEKNNDQ